MNADDLYQPLFSRARRVTTPRQYRRGGLFLAAMAIGALAIDGLHGWAAAVVFGLPALESFRLARRIEENAMLPSNDRSP